MVLKPLLITSVLLIFCIGLRASDLLKSSLTVEPNHPVLLELECLPSLKIVYQELSYQESWTLAKAHKAVKLFKQSELEGLNPSDYHLNELELLAKNWPKSQDQLTRLDLLLSDGLLLLCSHMLSGKVDPVSLDKQYGVKRREGNPIELLKEFIKDGDVQVLKNKITPKHSIYQNLKLALAAYLELQKAEEKIEITAGTAIKKGNQDTRLEAIKKRLIFLGDLEKSDVIDDRYDNLTFEAVIQFQKRHGLEAEGLIGAQTIERLNVSVSYRVEQLKANLERWRWLPNQLGDFYLIVNIANFELEVYKSGLKERTHKIIAGKPARKTPVFNATMKTVVFNPDWTVPPGIIRGDLVPGVKKDIELLSRKNISVYDGSGQLLDAKKIDWNDPKVYSYTYKQPPGKDCALGAVKFLFPNSHHVYLHDTPSKELFNSTERAFSSGCIRVERPLELAQYLLDNPSYTSSKIQAIVETNKTQNISLVNQPEVYLLYWTAWRDDNGKTHFRKDIYARDEALIQALKQ